MKAAPSLAQAARSLRGFFLRLLLSLRYRIHVRGMAEIPADRPLLFLANHPSLLDPLILWSFLDGLRPRFIADENQFGSPLLRWVKWVTRTITIPDYNVDGRAAREGVLKGLAEAATRLRAGESVLLFPAGGMQRVNDERLRNTSSVSRILQAAPEARVVGVRISGMWGSSFSRAPHGGEKPDFNATLNRGLKILAQNLFVFTPRRKLCIDFIEARDMPRPGADGTANAASRRGVTDWLNAFYAPALHEPVAVPVHFWDKDQTGPSKPDNHGQS